MRAERVGQGNEAPAAVPAGGAPGPSRAAAPVMPFVSASYAAASIGVSRTIFRFVNEAILGNKVVVNGGNGTYHMYHGADVGQVDAFLRAKDPRGTFRTKPYRAANPANPV